jgi:hypothetical protein
MSNHSDYVRVVSGYEVIVAHPNGLRTWVHPNRETQIARVTAVMVTVPDAFIIHDKEMKSGNQLVRQIKIDAARNPAVSSIGPATAAPVTARPTDDHWGKAVDAYEELGKAFDTGAFAPPETAWVWKAQAAKAITEIAMYLGLRERLERDHAETTAGDKP